MSAELALDLCNDPEGKNFAAACHRAAMLGALEAAKYPANFHHHYKNAKRFFGSLHCSQWYAFHVDLLFRVYKAAFQTHCLQFPRPRKIAFNWNYGQSVWHGGLTGRYREIYEGRAINVNLVLRKVSGKIHWKAAIETPDSKDAIEGRAGSQPEAKKKAREALMSFLSANYPIKS